MAKRLKIDAAEEADVLFIAISSQLKDYRIADALNRQMGIHLNKLDDLPVFHEKQGQMNPHSFYSCYDEVSRRTFNMIGNKSNDAFALHINPPMDFLLVISGRTKKDELANWLGSIRTENGILLAMQVNPKNDEKKALLMDLEIHHASLKKTTKQ